MLKSVNIVLLVGESMSVDEQIEKLNWEMFKKMLEKNPTFATFFGLHEPYDWMLPDGSAKNVFDTFALIEEWFEKLKEKIDFDALSDDHKIDWMVMEHAYELFKFQIQKQRTFETNPDAFDEIGGVLFIMLTRDYAPLEKRIDAIVARLEKVPSYLEQFRTRFEKSKPVKLWTQIALESCQRIPALLQFTMNATKGMISDELRTRLEKSVKQLSQPIEQHLEWLKNLLPRTKDEWALGSEKFEKLMQLRGLGMSSDEIHELGVDYLRRLKKERTRLAEQIAPGKNAEEALQLIEEKAPKSFEEALQATREQMETARKFVIGKNLATVYEEDKLLVEETPAFMAPLLPFAALIGPGKFDSRQVGNYIVTRPSEAGNLGKHLNYASIVNTAVHEGFPGHFLQMAVSNRGSFVRLFAGGTETIEGWALYCEEMMMEQGFDRSPELRFVQVNDAIWRAVRIIVDVKLSRGEMSFDEAKDMLMKEVGMSKEGAVAEVRRYTMSPGYPLSYLLGKHLILKLKKEVKQKMGDKFSERIFHDVLTANGELPMFLLRKAFDMKIAQLKAS
jgi:uncharacterized protein (DUF885 family)